MNDTQQRKRLHTTIPQYVLDKLDEIKEKKGFVSRSRALEDLVMEKTIGERIEVVIKHLEDVHVHKRSIPEEPKIVNDEGKTPREVLKEAETKVGVKSSIYKPGF